MIAVDTNILVYAYRPDYEVQHETALAALRGLMDSARSWSIPWPCVHEFLANVTSSRIYQEPAAPADALKAVSAWMQTENLSVLGEASTHFDTLRGLIERGRVSGPQIHDARIAAICLDHGVSELWTADRDFLKFPSLRTRNPLVDPE